MSDKSVSVQFAAIDLKPGIKCYWRVRVWDNNNKVSHWNFSKEKFSLNVEVHASTSDRTRVKKDGKGHDSVTDIEMKGTEDGYVIVKTGSGKYNFTVE